MSDPFMQRLQELNRILLQNDGLKKDDIHDAVMTILNSIICALGIKRASYWQLIAPDTIQRSAMFDADLGPINDIVIFSSEQFPSHCNSLFESDKKILSGFNIEGSSTFREQYLEPGNINSLLRAPVSRKGKLTGVLCCESEVSDQCYDLSESMFILARASRIAEIEMERERRISETELKESQANLEQDVLNKTKEIVQFESQLLEAERMVTLGELVAGVAHETNTPLGIAKTAISNIKVNIDSLEQSHQDNKLTPEALENYTAETSLALQFTTSNLHRASELVRSFRQVSSTQTSGSCTPFNISDMLKDIFATLNPVTKKYQVKILTDVPDHLTLLNHSSAFTQIITNLVMNSLNHAFTTTETGLIKLHILPQTEGLKIIYTDDGRGISQQNMKKVFEPFFTTARSTGGTGLGLSIVYNLVKERMGGEINLQSTEGQGVTFTLSLPSLNEFHSPIITQINTTLTDPETRADLANNLADTSKRLVDLLCLDPMDADRLHAGLLDADAETYFWPGLECEAILRAGLQRALSYDLPIKLALVLTSINSQQSIRTVITPEEQHVELYLLTPHPIPSRQAGLRLIAESMPEKNQEAKT